MRLAARLALSLLVLGALAAEAEERAGPPRFPGERNSTNDLGPSDPAPASLPSFGYAPLLIAPEIHAAPHVRRRAPWTAAPRFAPHPPRRRPPIHRPSDG